MARRKDLTDQFIQEFPPPQKTVAIHDSQIKNLAIRFYKTGGKSFVVRYYFSGKSKRITIGKYENYSIGQARIKAQSINQMVDQGKDPKAEKKKARREANGLTFKQAYKSYLKEHVSTKADTTFKKYRVALETNFERLHQITINDLTKKDVMNLCRKKNADGHSSQADAMIEVACSFLNWLRNNGEIETNFMARTARFTDKQKQKRERNFSYQELYTITTIIEGIKEPYRSYFKILMFTGQRCNETRLMKWKHIDSTKAEWIIPAENAKNGIRNVVPLTPQTIEVLNSIHDYSGSSKYVFNSPTRTNKPFNGIRYYSNRISAKINDYTNHDLRRTVATKMGEIGIIPFVIGRVLNHKQKGEDNTVTSTYNRSEYLPEKRDAMERWNKRLQQMIEYHRLQELSDESTITGMKGLYIDGKNVMKEEENEPVYSDLNTKF